MTEGGSFINQEAYETYMNDIQILIITSSNNSSQPSFRSNSEKSVKLDFEKESSDSSPK